VSNYVVDDDNDHWVGLMIMTKLVICIFLHFRIFSVVFCYNLCIMLMFAVGLGWVGSGVPISCGLGWVCKLMEWVGLGYRKWTHDHV